MPLAIPLIVLIAVLFSLGAAATARSTSGAFTSFIPGWLKKAALFAIPIAQAAVDLSRFIASKLGIHYGAIVHHAVRWFSELAHYVDVVGYWSLFWPVELYNFAERLIYHEIPTAIKARTAGLAAAIAALKARVGHLAHEVGTIPHRIKGVANTKELTRIERIAMPHAAEWDWIHDHFDALRRTVAAAAAAAGALVFPRGVSFPNWRGYTMKQLRRLWRERNYILSATGAAVIVARALGGVSANCVKKGAIGKTARSLCGLGSEALRDLLGLLVDYVIFTDVCQVVDLISQATSFLQAPIDAFVNVVDGALCHGDYSAPAALPAVTLYVPPTIGLILDTP